MIHWELKYFVVRSLVYLLGEPYHYEQKRFELSKLCNFNFNKLFKITLNTAVIVSNSFTVSIEGKEFPNIKTETEVIGERRLHFLSPFELF